MLAKVTGTVYLHLVSAVDLGRGRVQISNNRGRVNGWTSHSKVYGICTAVEGIPRPSTIGKILTVACSGEARSRHPGLDAKTLAVIGQAKVELADLGGEASQVCIGDDLHRPHYPTRPPMPAPTFLDIRWPRVE